jgi:hypothetical protein
VAFQFDDTTAESLLPGDLAILEQAERSLAAGVELQQVLADREHDANYQERFDIVSDQSSHEDSLGFFDVVSVRGNPMPVMGVVQESLYDRPKAGGAEMVRAQLWELCSATSRLPANPASRRPSNCFSSSRRLDGSENFGKPNAPRSWICEKWAPRMTGLC